MRGPPPQYFEGRESVFEGFGACPAILFSEFSVVSFLPWFHQRLAILHRVGLTFPYSSKYYKLEVQSCEVYLLHLMCRSHVQSGSPHLNDILANQVD